MTTNKAKFKLFSAKMQLTKDQLRQIKGGSDAAYDLDRIVESQTGVTNSSGG